MAAPLVPTNAGIFPAMPPGFALRRLGPEDARDYRGLRLEGLERHPEAFGAAFEDEVLEPLQHFAERLALNATFGASRLDGMLIGAASLVVPGAIKLRHKGILSGVFVRPEGRGTGLAPALIAKVLDHAFGVVEEVTLTVGAENAMAARLYSRFGFVDYGLDRRSLRVGDRYYDERLMVLDLRSRTNSSPEV